MEPGTAPATPPLDEYLARFRAGDMDALGALFDATAPGLFRAALHIAPDAAAADDALQETFVALIQAARGGATIREIGPWLAGTLRNKVLRGRRTERRTPDMHRLEERGAEDDPLAAAVRTEDRDRVRQALEELPEGYREVAVLRWRYGMEPAAIAHARGIAPGTVRSLLSRAAERLRPALGVAAVPFLAPHSPRGLGEIRAEVMRVARLAAPVAAGAGTAAVVGGLVMAKKIAVALVIVLLLAGSWAAVRMTSASRSSAAAPGEDRGGDAVVAAKTARHRADVAPAAEPAAAPVPAKDDVRPAFPRPQPSGTLVLRVVWDEDGSPAQGVWVRVYAWDGPDPFLFVFRDRTGDDGTVTFPAIYTGKAGIYVEAGGGEQASVEAGGRREKEVRVPRGIGVEGLVVDADGRPVADAIVAERGRDIAKTGPDGTFRLRAIENGAELGARAAGRAPSARYSIYSGAGNTVRLRMVLPGAGGAVAGRVLDAEGHLLAGALVRVGPENYYRQIVLEDGTRTQPQEAVEVRTDAKGEFRVEGVEAGNAVVRARAPGLAIAECTLPVTAGATARADLVLRPGATLVGVVKDGAGLPIPGAEIVAGSYGDFQASMDHAGKDGTYRLTGLSGGEARVTAESQSHGKTSATVTVAEGAEARWDPVLSQGCVTRGRVVDESGRPLAKWDVRASTTEQGNMWHGQAQTDGEGRFAIANCSCAVMRLDAIAPPVGDEFPWYPCAMRDGVRAGSDDVVITVKDRDLPSAYVTGRVLDPDGRPVDGASIQVRQTAMRMTPNHFNDAATGAFRVGPLPPADYEIVIEAKGWPAVRIGRKSVEPGAELDLGTIRLVAGGSVALKVKRADGTPVGNCWGEVYAEDGAMVCCLAAENDVARTGPLAPGSYRVRVEATRSASDGWIAVVPVDVRRGEEREVEATVSAAAFRTFRVTGADGSDLPGDVRYVLRDAAGAVVRNETYRSFVGFAFVPGTYSVEASTDAGLRASARFEVGAPGSTAAPVILAAR
jgi:RNA polymerase sigma factor (sigma-70 family)